MPLTVTIAWQHVIGVTLILVVVLFRDLDHPAVSFLPAMMVIYNMAITSISLLGYFKIVQMLPVVVSIWGVAVPVLGVFFDALIFRHLPTAFDYAALITVVAAVYLVLTARR